MRSPCDRGEPPREAHLNFSLRTPNDKLLLVWEAAASRIVRLGHSCPCFGIPFQETSTGKSAGATKAWSFLVSTWPAGLRLPMTIAHLIYLLHRQKLDLVQKIARQIEAVGGFLAEGEAGGNPEASFLARDHRAQRFAPALWGCSQADLCGMVR